MRISIHAPRTGSDALILLGLLVEVLFQSTLPARGATSLYHMMALSATFQSTLPARGATHQRRLACGLTLISIHAPRTGSDK